MTAGACQASHAVERVLVALDAERTPPDDARDEGSRAERRRVRVERSRRVVDRAVRHTVHRTLSTVADDVVSDVMRSVARQLLMTDDNVLRQSVKQQSTYDTAPSLRLCAIKKQTKCEKLLSRIQHTVRCGTTTRKRTFYLRVVIIASIMTVPFIDKRCSVTILFYPLAL